jgi:hypothetical protein
MRWDNDTRGTGVASASAFLPGLDALRAAAAQSDWVAEQPDAHLLPHLRRALEDPACAFGLLDVTESDGVLVLDLAWRGDGGNAMVVRDAFRLLASIAESSTHVHERAGANGIVELDIVTGMLAGQTGFEPHGHTLRLRVRREDS